MKQRTEPTRPTKVDDAFAAPLARATALQAELQAALRSAVFMCGTSAPLYLAIDAAHDAAADLVRALQPAAEGVGHDR